MKKSKRLTALALALVMVLGLTTGAGAAGAKYSSWFAPYYKEMQEPAVNIMPSSFANADLTQSITRGEMSLLAVIAFEKATGNKIDELERTDYFSDTTDVNILKAHEYGIVNGYPDGTFQPDKTLTRQEFFSIVQNFCKAAAYTSSRQVKTLSSFSDYGYVASWANESATYCVEKGFVDGTASSSGVYLRPTETTSRQEAMVMFLRCFKQVQEWYDANVTNAGVASVDEPDEFTDITSTTMYVIASSLNVRAYPSTDEHGTILGKLSYGATVSVTAKSNSWYRIKYSHNGVTCDAYVSRQYVDPSPTGTGSGTTSGNTSSGSGGSTATDIANFAMSFVGYSYVWGGMSPSTGFDCSGLMYYVLTQYGYSMKRVANDQMTQGTAISRDNLQVGDLVFFGYGSYANHVGMYIGNGNFVHASTPSTGVRVNSLNETYYNTRYIGARRII